MEGKNMSWGTVNPCYYCKKFINDTKDVNYPDRCTDSEKIQNAIYEIHQQAPGGSHKGSGTIAMVCTKVEAKN